MSAEDPIVVAYDDRIAFLKNELEYFEKLKAEHLVRMGKPLKKKPGPPPGFKKQNGENQTPKPDDRLSSRDESVTLTERGSPEVSER
jgi:hypothetical protein